MPQARRSGTAARAWVQPTSARRGERPERDLHHHQAAIDGQDLAGDVGGLVGGEEGDRLGDLVGRPEAAERRARA